MPDNPEEEEQKSLTEELGEIDEEKTFHNEKLGGSFTFRLPYVTDEIAVLRRRVQIMGVAESMAGPELLATSHAQAMFEVYCVHFPHNFKLEKLRSWGPFLELLSEVGDWHQKFFQRVG